MRLDVVDHVALDVLPLVMGALAVWVLLEMLKP